MAEKINKWTGVISLLISVLTMVTFIGWVADDRAKVWAQINDHRAVLQDHEVRTRCVERDLSELKTDVKWIRQTLESKP